MPRIVLNAVLIGVQKRPAKESGNSWFDGLQTCEAEEALTMDDLEERSGRRVGGQRTRLG